MHALVRRSSLALTCCLVVASLGACKSVDQVSGADRVQPKSCVIDSDCSSDGTKICSGGICIPNAPSTCANGETCPDGMECNALSEVCVPVSTPDGGTNNDDGGTNTTCSARCDCPVGNACMNGHCAAVALLAECATDAQCGRGQTCNFSHKCEAGCTESCDCEAPKTCSMTRFQCETCSASNPCPSGQVCSGSGATAQCVATVNCATSADCNSAAPGTICLSGTCANCTLDNQCQSAPYGSGYICSAGNCLTGCNTAQCNTTCTQQGLSCNTISCQCTAPECSDANCNGVACTGTDVCDSSCNCVPVGTSTDCTTNGCSNGQTCVSSAPAGASPFPGCGDGTSACATDCSFNSCPSGWECVDLTASLCTTFGLTSGQFCAKQCSSASDCPGGQDCCATSEGFNVCSALGACITM